MSRNDQPPQGGFPDQVYQRLAWLAERRPADPSVIQEAVAERRAAEAAALRKPRRTAEDPPTGNDGLWVSLGPTAVLGGQADTKPRVSGRVRALAVHPDGQRAYAGTANGGVWYTDDAGASWLPVGLFATERGGVTKAATGAAGAAGFAVGGLAVRFGDAADGSDDDVLVGTGELAAGSPGLGGFGGVGVLHATGPVPIVLADKLVDPWVREAKNLVGFGVYRLARNPDDPEQVVAATSRGLFKRTLPAAADSDWEHIDHAPFRAGDLASGLAGYPVRVTDVAWVKPPGAAGTRLWIALDDRRTGQGGGQSGLWVADVEAGGDIGAFARVVLDGLSPNARVGIAAAAPASRLLYVLSVTDVWSDLGSARLPCLWRIDDATSLPTVRRVERVPCHLFGGPARDQHYYDLTIAVDPTDAERVVLGGSLVLGAVDWSAALFVCDVQAGGKTGFQLSYDSPAGKETSDPTWRGPGVHPDVHAAVFARSSRPAAERDLWIGCDGGVFVSHRTGARDSFVARNTGIASLEVGYIAGNPDNDVEVLAGTQDNGTIRRIGASVWKVHSLGDGGGLAYDPGRPDRFVYQYINAIWHDHTGELLRFVFRSGDTWHPQPDEENENNASSFYSDADAVVTGGRTLLAIGTNRVWVSDGWGVDGSWVTLPSGRDPKDPNGPDPTDTTTDLCVPTGSDSSTVLTLRWSPSLRHTSGPLRLLVLCKRAVIVHHISDNPTHSPRLTSRAFRVDNITHTGRMERQEPAGIALHDLPACTWTDAFWHDQVRGVHGSFYVATAGPKNPTAPDPPDTLWWFDGKDTWFPTGLRSSRQGTKAPAYAVVVDPDDHSIVYVGTGAGVWRGTLNVTTTTWSWVVFSNGLPEATVADLEILKVGAVKLLRAGVQALGVFEVDLTGPTPPRTFLRVHELDSRRVAPPATMTHPPASPPDAQHWAASPDIRPRMDTGAPAPAPPANSAQHITDPPETPFDQHRLWVFQTALRQIDPLVRADGSWSADFEQRMLARRRAAGIPLTPIPRVDGRIWTDVVTPTRCYAAPWDETAPTEADLLELVVDRPAPAGDRASLALTRGPAKVEVLVHHRHVVPVDPLQVRVVLLRHALAASPDDGAALPVTFTAKVAQALVSASPPTGGWGSLPDGWAVADAATPMRSPALRVHPRTPRAVSFDVDFSAGPANSRWILVAAASSTLDPPAFTGANLRDLVLRSRWAAARTVRLV
jgi:hypothetical protein